MHNKVISVEEAVNMIPDGATIMFGGFLGCGSAHKVIEALAKKGTKDLTIIGNDCGMATGPHGEEFYGMAKLVHNHQVKRVIATHVGMTPDVGTQGMVEKTLQVDLVPQGSLAEMIRAGGAGLGGVLTPTGVGTIVAEGKQEIVVDGKTYLLETPLRAEVAIVKAWKADTSGNLVYRRAGKNFNPMMAMAADFVIAEVEEIVEVGQIDPDQVCTPGACVDMVVQL
mgnify:CR=1 FL=1